MIDSLQTPVALRRYARALERLRQDMKRSMHMEIYHGLGEITVRVYRGIYEGISGVVDDPYLAALSLNDVATPTKDKEKFALVNLLSGQLQVYLESMIAAKGDAHYGD